MANPPLLMCKVLVTQIISERRPYFDELREKWHIPQLKSGRPPLVCSLIWLQGTVGEVIDPNQFILDDATGSMHIQCQDDEPDSKSAVNCPKVGQLVAVIGKLKPPDDAKPHWKVIARTIIDLVPECDTDSKDSSTQSTEPTCRRTIIKSSWPLEVQDMADHFYSSSVSNL